MAITLPAHPQPRLFELYQDMNSKNSEQLQKLQSAIVDGEKRNMTYVKRYNKIQVGILKCTKFYFQSYSKNDSDMIGFIKRLIRKTVSKRFTDVTLSLPWSFDSNTHTVCTISTT